MKAVGIDFGTTNSVIAVIEGGQPSVIPNSRGENLTPSAVSFTDSGEILTGSIAKNQSVINSDKTVLSVKRYMGEEGKFNINGKDYRPEEIASIIISRLKKDAEEFLGISIDDAVITVPAYFSDSQRKAVKDAGAIAGLNVLQIINEPTAAALAYSLNQKEDEKIIVYDLGGGTFDISVLDIADEVIEVMATMGNNKLGGDDFDELLIDFINKKFYEENNIDLTQDKMSYQKLREEAERVKKELSESVQAQISVPFITADASGPKHLNITIKRAEFEGLIENLIESTFKLMEQALADADTEKNEISKVVLVGGSTRIPLVQEKIKENFSDAEIFKGINPDEVVAKGAAYQASFIQGGSKGLTLVDVTPLTLGIKNEPDIFVPIIERNTPIPFSASKIFTTVSDNQTEVEIEVYQGERKKASENIHLGKFTLTNIAKAAKGAPTIEVKFDIDVNGIVKVSAVDKNTDSKQEIAISDSSGLTEDEIQSMIKEAESRNEEDKLYEKFVKLNNDFLKLSGKYEALMKEEIQNADDLKIDINKSKACLREEFKKSDFNVPLIEDEIQKYKFMVEELELRKLSASND